MIQELKPKEPEVTGEASGSNQGTRWRIGYLIRASVWELDFFVGINAVLQSRHTFLINEGKQDMTKSSSI